MSVWRRNPAVLELAMLSATLDRRFACAAMPDTPVRIIPYNPIPLNPTPGSKWTASRTGVQQQFVERLRAHGIPTTVRDTRGREIDGACGQLAATTA